MKKFVLFVIFVCHFIVSVAYSLGDGKYWGRLEILTICQPEGKSETL